MIEADLRYEAVFKMRDAVRSGHEKAVRMLALEAWGNIGEEAPKDHGRLAGGFRLSRISELAWLIATAIEYAATVHEGSRPHTIRPKNRKALRFQYAGGEVFARSVQHPGTAPNRYIDRAIDKAERRIPEFVTAALASEGLL